ncbi:MAG: hypothetical protein SFU85_06280 [Candidatus Methylacidiphilales bacterium]|nr:hypothetical protein [Candidatus Methylacidiphilales bacterium]
MLFPATVAGLPRQFIQTDAPFPRGAKAQYLDTDKSRKTLTFFLTADVIIIPRDAVPVEKWLESGAQTLKQTRANFQMEENPTFPILNSRKSKPQLATFSFDREGWNDRMCVKNLLFSRGSHVNHFQFGCTAAHQKKWNTSINNFLAEFLKQIPDEP